MAGRMMMAAALALVAAQAQAAPTVATDIAPVHALAARVMQGLGEPTLLLPPGASPHGYALRPSDAAALEGAAVVFWVGEALTPWLERSIAALAARATVVELAAAPGVTLLPLREDARFAAHGHDNHAAGAGGEHADHGHGHGDGFDPHLWLDPANAALWLDAMAATLAQADPANAAAYAANAAAGRQELAALKVELDATLAPVRGRGFIVAHDAYQYFEAAFAVPAAGAVALSDARAPGAARISEIRAAIEAAQVACVFTEPQLSPALTATLVEGTGARSGVLDPLGAGLAPGAALYPALLRGVAASLADCLRPAS